MDDSRVCHACGRPNPGDARFCGGCGTSLAVGMPRGEGRKVVSALFADVVGSTALGERHDPEDLQAILGEGIARAVRATQALGGHVERVAGDGALVLFGAPVAHEDDPERAVLAGLRVLEAIELYAAELAAERGVEGFAVRVGVETGLAVLAPVGGRRAPELGATGDVLNTAARLEASAEPGCMLVGPRTFEVTEPAFDWDEPVELELKGKAGVVVAHRPRAPRALGARRGPPGHARLVGREPELEIVGLVLGDLLAGAGGTLFVQGEAGLGKTRLLAELRRRSQRSDEGAARWLEGRCASYSQTVPYFPFQVLLRGWLGMTPEHPEGELARLLHDRLDELFGDDGADVRPFLGSVLGLALPPDATAMTRLHPEDLRHRVFDAFAELLRRLAADEPVLVAVDDVHWADAASLALLEHLLELTVEAPLLLVIAGRPESGRAVGRLRDAALAADLGRTRSIELEALAAGAERELLSELAGGAGLPGELERLVLERAEGNPLYLEELVRSLIDAGALVREGRGWRFVREAEVQIPETVEKLVLSRVDVLSPGARELVCAASVLGRRFTRTLLAEVAGDGRDLDMRLDELRDADLVSRGRRSPEHEYTFRHHLIQETTYASLLRRRRRELHRQAAEAMERVYADRIEDRLGLLAHHWRRAGKLERAFDYHARAGAAAWHVAAPKEALEQYDAAVEAVDDLAMDDARSRRVRLERGRIHFNTGDPEGGGRDFKRVLEDARRAGDRATEIDALTQLALLRYGGHRNAVELAERAVAIARETGDERAQVNALSRLAILDAGRLRLDRALDESREALSIARRRGDEGVTGLALDGLKLAELKLGELSELETHCDELVEIHRRSGDAFFLAWALLESAEAPLARGQLGPALERAREALALNERLGDRANKPLFLDANARVHRAGGDYGRALELARLAHEVAARHAPGEWEAWCAATVGWILRELGEAREAASVLERGVAAATAAGATGELLRCAAHLACAAWTLGERDRGLALADEAGAMIREITAPPGGAWLFGAHSQLAVARVRLESGDPGAAAAIARPLADAAERVGWHEAFAAATAVLARCEEQPNRATRLLERALAAADAAGRSAVAWEVRLELDRLGPDGRYAAEARELMPAALGGGFRGA